MYVRTLTLKNFRSYQKHTFEYSTHTTLVVGKNASGKTNSIEALVLASQGKSFRTDRDRDMVSWDQEVGTVAVSCFIDESVEELLVFVTSGMVSGKRAPIKKYQHNGVPRRMVDFVGTLKTVLFWPEDLSLVIGSPSRRRIYLDSVLIQVDREYRRNLQSYERGLRQRNRLLKRINEGTAQRSQLLFWDQLLIKTGQYISQKRTEFIDFINSNAWIDGHAITIHYDDSRISEARLAQYADASIAARTTLVGPHRDDLLFIQHTPHGGGKQEGRNLKDFGSRGEQRFGVLWVKIAELSYVEQVSGARPILLLDDIFSELDEEHRDLVLALCDRQQTIITTADRESIPAAYQQRMHVIEL